MSTIKTNFIYNAVYRSNYDGDTIRFDFDLGLGNWQHGQRGKGVAVRLKGVNCKEMRGGTGKSKESARKAQEYVEDMLTRYPNVVVQTFKDTKSFDRYIADVYITVDGVQVSLADLLVADGLAIRVDY